MLDLRLLGHLVALADERHFGRAAQQAHLSQPAFSRSIQALERATGQQLFDREKGEVKPTPAGAFLIEKARRILFEARLLQRDVKLYGDGRLGNIAFGAGPFPAATLMPRVLPELRRLHAQVQVRVEVSNWVQLLDSLRAEDIEFFIADVTNLPVDPTLEITRLDPQPGRFYVRSGHPLSGRQCSPTQMWRFGVATTRLPAQVLAALGTLLGLPPGRSPELALQCDDVGLLRCVALSTDTVVGLTDAAVRQDVAAGSLMPVSVGGMPPLQSHMGVVSIRNWTPSPMAQRVIDLIAAAGRDVNLPA